MGWNISLHFIVHRWIILREAFFGYKKQPHGKMTTQPQIVQDMEPKVSEPHNRPIDE